MSVPMQSPGCPPLVSPPVLRLADLLLRPPRSEGPPGPLWHVGRLRGRSVLVDGRAPQRLHGVELLLLLEVLDRAEPPGAGTRRHVVTVDLGRIVGHNRVVPTGPGDCIFYQRRPGCAGHSRFVEGRAAAPTSQVTLV